MYVHKDLWREVGRRACHLFGSHWEWLPLPFISLTAVYCAAVSRQHVMQWGVPCRASCCEVCFLRGSQETTNQKNKLLPPVSSSVEANLLHSVFPSGVLTLDGTKASRYSWGIRGAMRDGGETVVWEAQVWMLRETAVMASSRALRDLCGVEKQGGAKEARAQERAMNLQK